MRTEEHESLANKKSEYKMDSFRDALKTNIISLEGMKEVLTNLYAECDNVRKSTISKAESLWRGAKENPNQDFSEAYRIAKDILQDIRINIITNLENIVNLEESDHELRNGARK